MCVTHVYGGETWSSTATVHRKLLPYASGTQHVISTCGDVTTQAGHTNTADGAPAGVKVTLMGTSDQPGPKSLQGGARKERGKTSCKAIAAASMTRLNGCDHPRRKLRLR